ncbi:MAG TPA: hypothetical protein VL461_10485 [Dictyobacter sp.]|jgi:Ca2+:H+ antiporter|nr:hypothetical protein [Dictyobacter sp.]
MPRWLYFLLVFSVLAVVLSFFYVPPMLLFIVAALGIIPLASLIGQAVEGVAEHTGERIGGLLFATFGNATELIIGILALMRGLVGVVSASIIGSVLGNLLLVLGVSLTVGGIRHGRLRFETRPASQYASLLALSIGGLLLPTIAELFATREHQAHVVENGIVLSDFIAVLLLIGYVASILFSVFQIGDKVNGEDTEVEFEPLIGARSLAAITRLMAYRRHVLQNVEAGRSGLLHQIDGAVDAIVAHDSGQEAPDMHAAIHSEAAIQSGAAKEMVSQLLPDAHATEASEKKEHHPAPLWRSLLILLVATIGVGIISEILVDSIEPMTEMLHWNQAFVGLVFLPLIGGLPEYINTISMALDKRIGMVLSASAGSSIQIALLMAPLLVLISLFAPVRLDLVFSLVELAVLALATFLFSEITKDGELVWLEGLLLILLYAIMAGTVFIFGSIQI